MRTSIEGGSIKHSFFIDRQKNSRHWSGTCGGSQALYVKRPSKKGTFIRVLVATVIASRSSGSISYAGLVSQKQSTSGSSSPLTGDSHRGLGDVHSEVLQHIQVILDAGILPALINISASKFAIHYLILQDVVHNGE